MKRLTQKRLYAIQRLCDEIAEKLDRSNEQDACEFVTGLVEQVRDYVMRETQHWEPTDVRFQHDNQEAS